LLEERLDVAIDARRAEEHVLRGDELVLQRLGLVLGALKHLIHAPRERGLRAAAAHAWILLDLLIEELHHVRGVCARLLQKRRDDASLLPDDRAEDVLRIELGIAASARKVCAGSNGFLSFGG